MVKVPVSVPNETVAPLDEWEPGPPGGLKMEAKDKPQHRHRAPVLGRCQPPAPQHGPSMHSPTRGCPERLLDEGSKAAPPQLIKYSLDIFFSSITNGPK